MKLHRINALVIRHLYLYQRSLPRIMDIVYWPVMELVLWGFLSAYIDKLNLGSFNVVTALLGAVIFWDFLNQSQKAVSIAFLEEVWEKNLLNIFVTPLRVSEFLASTMIIGIVRLVLVGIVLGALAFVLYEFNLFSLGFALIPFMLNLFLFGWALGLLANAVVLRFGTSAQILAWGFLVLVQPFSAVFYPVSALPAFLHPLAYLLPSTYVFEGMREVLATGSFAFAHLSGAIAANAAVFAIMVWLFFRMFRYVKKEGKLLKLEG